MKVWLTTTGSPASVIERCEFRNEHELATIEYKDFIIRHQHPSCCGWLLAPLKMSLPLFLFFLFLNNFFLSCLILNFGQYFDVPYSKKKKKIFLFMISIMHKSNQKNLFSQFLRSSFHYFTFLFFMVSSSLFFFFLWMQTNSGKAADSLNRAKNSKDKDTCCQKCVEESKKLK